MSARRRKLILYTILVVTFGSSAAYVATQRINASLVGSTMERAIPNPIVDGHESHEFEKQYLREHFHRAEFRLHATVVGKTPDTMYSMYELTFRGKKRELWFDVTPAFREFTKDM